MSYKLNLKFVDGSHQEVTLNQVHRLIPDTVRPHALIYVDDNKQVHNIPFSSLLDFWFVADEYNKQDVESLKAPTEGCDCDYCVKARVRIKTLASSFKGLISFTEKRNF